MWLLQNYDRKIKTRNNFYRVKGHKQTLDKNKLLFTLFYLIKNINNNKNGSKVRLNMHNQINGVARRYK